MTNTETIVEHLNLILKQSNMELGIRQLPNKDRKLSPKMHEDTLITQILVTPIGTTSEEEIGVLVNIPF